MFKPRHCVVCILQLGYQVPTIYYILYAYVPVKKIVIDCGRLTYTKAEPQILKGTKVKYGTAPWNVAIYETQNNSLICGGTLISPNLVVSGKKLVCIKIDEDSMFKLNLTEI